MQLYYLDPCFMHVFLAMYYEIDVMLYYAWSLFLELRQAHYKKMKIYC